MAKATDIENALVSQLIADANIATEFTGKISKGLGRNFNYNTEGQGIRVYLLGSNPEFTNAISTSEITSYFYMVTVLFSDSVDESIEVRKATYDAWVRSAIKGDLSIGGTAMDTSFGKTEYRENPNQEALHYVLIEIEVRAYEV